MRIGFLGAGAIARQALAPAVHGVAGGELFAAAARDPRRAGALEPERVHRDYAAVLADPDVEAVYIALANDAHLPWALAALRAGKHVLCEKPLALDVDEVDRLTEAARAAGRLLVEASWYQWHPRTVRARDLLASGAIGTVTGVDGGFGFRGVSPGNYRLDPRFGGGAGYDVGCYPVSAVLWAAGRPVTTVAARARLGPSGVDLATEMSLDLAGGGAAQVRCSMDGPEQQWLRITGESGAVELESPAFTSLRSASWLLVDAGGQQSREQFAPCDPYALMVEAFCAAVRGEQPWLVPASQSRACAAVLQAARASADSGGIPVVVP